MPRARAGSTGKEYAMRPALYSHGAVGLQRLEVNGVLLAPVKLVSAKATHKVGEQPYAEQVQPRTVSECGQTHFVQYPAHHNAVHIAEVRGHYYHRTFGR